MPSRDRGQGSKQWQAEKTSVEQLAAGSWHSQSFSPALAASLIISFSTC